jgi:anti-sigma factor RsiW
MTEDQQLKLQAFLDGELSEKEAREMASWLARDAEATALGGELRNTRKALKDSEPNIRVPESREFYWSKIQREIERQEPALAPERRASVFGILRRLLVPTATVAVILAVGLLAGRQAGLIGPLTGPESEMTVADSGAFTYEDYANGTTLVWVSYPAESEFAQNTVR